jgi:hypothetical protein
MSGAIFRQFAGVDLLAGGDEPQERWRPGLRWALDFLFRLI